MVTDLNITDKLNANLQATLEKFLTLFWGGLGKLAKCKSTKIKLKKWLKPHARRYYNFPEAYVKPGNKEIKHMVDISIMNPLP